MADIDRAPGPELLEECVELFKALVRTDTTNPPGGEGAAAELLARVFGRRGIGFELVEVEPGRTNIVARLPGGPKPPLVLLSHLDVVAADAERWTRPPFSAEEHQGSIWGRGTLDTKQLTAMELAAFLFLADSGIRPNREVIFAATADEEAGSRLGMEPLAGAALRVPPGAVAVSEGGGFPIELGGRWFVLCTAGEKGMCKLRLSADGRGGFAALAEGLSRILRHQSPPDLRGIPLQFVERLGLRPETLFPRAEAGAPSAKHPAAAPAGTAPRMEDETGGLLHYVLHDSVMVNRIGQADQADGAPEVQEAELELRVSPSATKEGLRKLFATILADAPVRWELESFEPGFECDPDSPLPGLLAAACRRFGLEAELLPILALGRTDGRFLGWQGTSVYGFSPVLPRDDFRSVLSRVHGVDERIGRDSFEFGCKVLTRAITELCAPLEE